MARRPTLEDLATRPIINPAPDTMPDNLPRSRTVDRAAILLSGSEVMTGWNPRGAFHPRPYFGGHDELSRRGHGVMHTAQAGMYDPTANAWPNNGQFGNPNAFWAGLMRLQPDTSAHKGFTTPTGAGPAMLFHAPPLFSLQTQPIPAVGV